MGKAIATNPFRKVGGGGESGEQPTLNRSLQLRQGQKTMGLLTGDCRSWEGYSMLKSHESMVQNYRKLCRMITHVVNDYVTLDIDLRLLHYGQKRER